MDQVIEIMRMMFGAVYVLFLPGFVLSYVFFQRGAIDIIERLALSFALSIAVVPLVVFYLNLMGVKISFWAVVFEVLVIIVVCSLAAWRLKRWGVVGDGVENKPDFPVIRQLADRDDIRAQGSRLIEQTELRRERSGARNVRGNVLDLKSQVVRDGVKKNHDEK